MVNSAELEAIISSETALGEQLIELVAQERQLLETRQLDEIPSLLETKASLLEQLEQAYRRRQSWLELNGLSATETDSSLPEHTRQLLSSCKSLYKKINYFNSLNGILIANSRKRARLQMEIMRGLPAQDRMYDASGATTAAAVPRNLSSA